MKTSHLPVGFTTKSGIRELNDDGVHIPFSKDWETEASWDKVEASIKANVNAGLHLYDGEVRIVVARTVGRITRNIESLLLFLTYPEGNIPEVRAELSTSSKENRDLFLNNQGMPKKHL